MERRDYISSVASAFVGALAGCNSINDDDDVSSESDGENTPTSSEGSPSPELEISQTSVEPAEIVKGDKFRLSYIITNRGGSGTGTVEIELLDGIISSSSIELGEGESQTKSVELTAPDVEPGDYDVTVHSSDTSDSTSINILEGPSLEIKSVQPRQIVVEQGESADVSVTVENYGDTRGTEELKIFVDNTPVYSRSLTIERGIERELSPTIETVSYEPGAYDIDVKIGDANEQITLSVDPPTPDLEKELSMPRPQVTEDSYEQSTSEFTMQIKNRGDSGSIGYGVLIDEDSISRGDNTAAKSTTSIGSDRSTEETLTVEPESIVFYYDCISWAGEAEITISNTNNVSGEVEVKLKEGRRVVAERSGEIESRGELTYSVELDRPRTAQPDYTIEASTTG